MSDMQKKNSGAHRLRFKDKSCQENYTDFEKLAHVIQRGLQGFIVKNI